MKALSIIMPWPLHIMKGGKDVENRSWETKHRGRILIHVSKRIPFMLLHRMELSQYTAEELDESCKWFGCIIGSVEIVDCVRGYDSKWAEKDMWHWVLKDPTMLKEPIPYRGSLGLWEYTGGK
jgi:hypothetical protein